MGTMIHDNRKEFEKPKNGTYIGVVADVVDLGMVDTVFNGQIQKKPKIRIVWLLNSNDSEGKPFQVASQVNASANEKSALYQIVKGILGNVPPPPFDAEILIGKSNQLFIVNESNKEGTKTYANVKVILPLPDGTAMAVPAGFVRSKDRQQPQGQAPAPRPAAAPQPVAAPKPLTSNQIDAEEEIAF